MNSKFRTQFSNIAVAAFIVAFAVIAVVPSDYAQARGGGGRGGGGMSRPSGGGIGGGGFSRPSGGGMSRPGSRPATTRPMPSTRPAVPARGPINRPGTLPAYPGGISTGRTNINTGDINVNRNVNVDNGWGNNWNDDWGSFAAGAVVGGITGAAIANSTAPGTTVYTLPSSCTVVVVGGVTYQTCDGVYYMPSYEGSSVVYEVVPTPY